MVNNRDLSFTVLVAISGGTSRVSFWWGSSWFTITPRLRRKGRWSSLCPVYKDLLELTPKRRRPFHHRGLECTSRKSKDTWSNRQIWPWSTKWSKAKAKRVLPRECTGHSKHPLPTTQGMTLHTDITRWSVPKSHRLYSLQLKMEKLYTVSKNKAGSWLVQIIISLLKNSGSSWRK